MRVAVVGVPGVPERDSGRIMMAPNIAGLDAFDFASELEDALDMEVHVENDVNLAVQGENWLGAGGGADNLAFIALGTGIGAGLVLGGQLVRGAAGAAGELGFLPFGSDALSQHAQAEGALERIVATDGIRSRYQERTGRQATVPAIFDRADRGDTDAAGVLDETAEYLARAIVALCALTDPGTVILGGSIGGARRAGGTRARAARRRRAHFRPHRAERARRAGDHRRRRRRRARPPAQHPVRAGRARSGHHAAARAHHRLLGW